MKTKIISVTVSDCDLETSVAEYIEAGYEFLGFSYTGGTLHEPAGDFMEVTVLYKLKLI
jgi:hypothetical protein